MEALRRLQARGERGVFAIPPFQGLLGALQAAIGGLAGEGQTPRSGPRLGTPRPHTFPPPGGLPPPTSPCRVYAGIPGDPPQLHAGRPPLQALPMREGELSRRWKTPQTPQRKPLVEGFWKDTGIRKAYEPPLGGVW